MWYSIKYNPDSKIVTHVVEEALLEWHNDYIKASYDIGPIESKEIMESWIDPGGAIVESLPVIKIKDKNDLIVKIKSEHILVSIQFFFSKKIYEAAAKQFNGSKRNPIASMVRFKTEDVLKVYMPQYILVMSPHTYLSICEGLERSYIDGIHAMLELASATGDDFSFMAALSCVPISVVGEA